MPAPHASYDTIVVGLGGVGSSCLYHLARRGRRVLGLDRFPIAHDRGSSHGDTRIIRQAYFENADYVPLLSRAYELWRELEAESGRPLMRLCGLLLSGPPDGDAVSGSLLAARQHGLNVRQCAGSQAAERFPAFRIPDSFASVYEPDAGYLHVEDCVRTHVEMAIRHGATVRTGETVRDWSADSNQAVVSTETESWRAASLVLAPGAWAANWPHLSRVLPPLDVRRKVMLWYPVQADHCHVDAGMPGFYFDMPTGQFYGFPSLDGKLLKVAQHDGGDPVSDPLQVDRSLLAQDVEPVSGFLSRVIPDVRGEPARFAVCLYSMTPDGHFLIDRHPDAEHIVFGAGFSGHGFKFTSVLGEALADLASAGSTDLPVGFLSRNRFQRPGRPGR